MLKQAGKGARRIWLALPLAVAGLGSGVADAQSQGNQTPSAPLSGNRVAAYSFRPGELRDREAKAAEQCKQQNLAAALTAIDYLNSVEGFYYSAKFVCGPPSTPGFPTTYKRGDRARLEEDIARYCKEHGGEMSRGASDSAPGADTFKATYECK
jgi:hypothetical protein